MAEHPMGNGGGLMRVARAAKCSLQGLQAAWHHESAFRQELTLCLLFVPLAIWLADSVLTGVVLIATLCIVLIAELLNSAVEAVVDRGPILELIVRCPVGTAIITYSRPEALYCGPSGVCGGNRDQAIRRACGS